MCCSLYTQVRFVIENVNTPLAAFMKYYICYNYNILYYAAANYALSSIQMHHLALLVQNSKHLNSLSCAGTWIASLA